MPTLASLLVLWLAQGSAALPSENRLLPNGLVVLRQPAPAVLEAEIHIYFRGGLLLDGSDRSQLEALLRSVASPPASREGLSVRAELGDEFLHFWVCAPAGKAREALRLIRDRIWTGSQGSAAPSSNLPISSGDSEASEPSAASSFDSPHVFLSRLLRRSPYARMAESARWGTPLRPENLQYLRRNIFSPANGLMIVRGDLGWDEIGGEMEGGGVPTSQSGYSVSFSFTEEPLHVDGSRAMIPGAGQSVEMAVVFSAPPRGSPDLTSFVPVYRTYAENFGNARVRAWSGVGVGLFWVRYRCSPERFAELFPRFVQEVKSLRDRCFRGDFPPPLLEAESMRQDSDRLAADYFWGAGIETAWLGANAGDVAADSARATARAYLRRSFLFVLWPESRAGEWTGFPEDSSESPKD